MVAQEALQRRMRSRWWFHLPEGLGVAGAVVFLMRPDVSWLLYFLALLLVPTFRSLCLALRAMEPRYFARSVTGGVLTIGIIDLSVLVITATQLPGEPTPLRTSAAALLAGLIVASTQKIADRRFRCGLPGLGSDLASRSQRPGGIMGPLQGPQVLQAVVMLAPARVMRCHALENDLRLSPPGTSRVLEPLERLGLIEGYRQLFGSRRPERRWYRLTYLGERALSSHLAAMAEWDTIEQRRT